MKRVKFKEFDEQTEHFIGRVVDENLKVKVVDDDGKAAVLISLKEWSSLNETLFVLQDNDLLRSIARSLGNTPVSEKVKGPKKMGHSRVATCIGQRTLCTN